MYIKKYIFTHINLIYIHIDRKQRHVPTLYTHAKAFHLFDHSDVHIIEIPVRASRSEHPEECTPQVNTIVTMIIYIYLGVYIVYTINIIFVINIIRHGSRMLQPRPQQQQQHM